MTPSTVQTAANGAHSWAPGSPVQTPEQTGPRPYFHLLDAFRAIAAFLVVFEHARNYLLIDYEKAGALGWLWKTIYFTSQFGHEAVIIFFVLSGCVVGGVVLSQFAENRWSFRHYLFDRLTRLWIVLIPALLLTVACDHMATRYAPAGSFVFEGGFANIQHEPIAEKNSLAIFIGNAAFLQTIAVPTLGSNGPLWSLAYEFWYYVAFPLFCMAALPRGQSWCMRAICAGAGVSIILLVGPSIRSHFPIWLLGVASVVVYRRFKPHRITAAVGLPLSIALLGVLLVAQRFGWFGRLIPKFAVVVVLGLACALSLYFAMGAKENRRLRNVAGWFSSFSYTLYLVHLPILTFGTSLVIANDEGRLEPSPQAAAALFSAIFGCYVVSYTVSLVTERQTGRLRRWLPSRFTRAPVLTSHG